MRLIQYLADDSSPRVGRIDGSGNWILPLRDFRSSYELAQAAIRHNVALERLAMDVGEDIVPYAALLRQGRVLCPLTHHDPAHCHVTGTGLTHLGSASSRDAMHAAGLAGAESGMSDSMRMFKWGVEGGRHGESEPGVQPEWFYKGDGDVVVPHGKPLRSPHFALDAGEEAELVGLYVIDPRGVPYRLGFSIGNEMSDHVTERMNYLYLAHSKLRQCAVGPELRTGTLPAHLEGRSRIRRNGELLWEQPFLTGDANMCHSIANLEYHHFKYDTHRRAGDVHLHFFGASTLSCSDGVRVESGDVFEIELPALGVALSNPLQIAAPEFSFSMIKAL